MKTKLSITLLAGIALPLITSAQTAELVKNENEAVCNGLLQKINDTPTFFQEVATKGDAWILLESPLKRDTLDRIPKFLFLAVAGVHDSLNQLEKANDILNHNPACQNYSHSSPAAAACNAALNLPEYQTSTLERYQPWLDAPDYVLYLTPTHYFGTEDDAERPIKKENIIGYTSRHKRQGDDPQKPESFYFLVNDSYVESPELAESLWRDFGTKRSSIPVDVQGRTYDLKTVINDGDNHLYLTAYTLNTEQKQIDAVPLCEIRSTANPVQP